MPQHRPTKHPQLIEFLQNGLGRSHEAHRLQKTMMISGGISYFLARNSKLKETPFSISSRECFYAAEISSKDNPCGIILANDLTSIYHPDDFIGGFTPYKYQIKYSADLTANSFKGLPDHSQDLLASSMSKQYFEMKQDFSRHDHFKMDFAKALTDTIHKKYDPHFGVAALL